MIFEKLNELFDLLENEFPYTSMGDSFKGSHFLIKKDGMLILNTWWEGQAWQTGIQEKDLDNIPSLVQSVRDMIKTWPKK